MPLLFTQRRTSELIKYAANAFQATKIGFINEIADLCEATGADVQEVARGIGLDNRIGGKFLHAGPDYGGPFFPKDTQALIRTAHDFAIIQAPQDAGAHVRAYDPEGVEQVREVLDQVEYAANAYDCVKGADAICLVTEWDEFRALDLDRVRQLAASPVLVDLRNVYRPEEARRRGFTYVSVGRA